MLTRFTKQMWRTDWFGEGIKYLNDCRENIFAITLDLEQDPQKPADKTDQSAKADVHKGF